jgi:tripartite-type tricarboxylate transporter receptor subunit TctC
MSSHPQQRRIERFALCAWLFLLTPTLTQAASAPESASGAGAAYPTRPIRIIIGFLPGSSTDIFARFISAHLTERLGQQAIVDNRAGANGIIAGELTAKATADGHTLLLMSVSHTMNAAVQPKLPFDPVKSFTPIGPLGSGALLLVAHPGFAPDTVKELIEFARAKPQAVQYAIAGIGGINHFSAALFSRIAQVRMTPIAYKGGAPALTDVIAGQVPIMFATFPLSLRQIRAGKLKALGVTSAQRSAHLPNVPTVAEAGAAGYEIGTWWGMIAPAGVPAGIVAKLNGEIAAILKLPESTKRLEADGAAPWIMGAAEFGKHMAAQVEKWKHVAREAGIKPD